MTPLEAHAQVQRGVPLADVRRFGGGLGLTQDEFARLLGIPTRTYQRWLGQAGRRLSPAASGRYYRIARIVRRAVAVLGSEKTALGWLREEQRALGQRVPLDLMATEPGAEAVEDLLGRIEYGVVT